MPTKRHKPEEVVAKLRHVGVLVSQGKSVADAVHAIGVTQPLGPRPPTSRRAHLGRMATSGRSTPGGWHQSIGRG